jgi:hypothetical protein
VWSPHPRAPTLGISCWCPSGMRMVLVVRLCRSRFSYFCPEFKKWCRGDRSRVLLVPVAHRRPVVALAMEVSCARGAPQGAAGVEVADAGPRVGDSAGSLLQDLVVHGTGAGIPGGAALCDVAPAPGSSSAVGSGISGLYLPGSPGSLPHPLTRDGWEMRQCMCVRKLPPWRGCYMRCWPQSTRTSCA